MSYVLVEGSRLGDPEICAQTPCGRKYTVGVVKDLYAEYPVVEFLPVKMPEGPRANPHVGLDGLKQIVQLIETARLTGPVPGGCDE